MNALTALNIARIANNMPVHRIDHEPHTDHMCDPFDVTDAYIEETGDEDAQAFMYFDHNNDGSQYNPVCVGLAVTENGLTFYYTAEGAISLLGVETVCRLENVYSEVIN